MAPGLRNQRLTIWSWGITYGVDEYPFATYFDVQQGYRVLTHSHLGPGLIKVDQQGRPKGEKVGFGQVSIGRHGPFRAERIR